MQMVDADNGRKQNIEDRRAGNNVSKLILTLFLAWWFFLLFGNFGQVFKSNAVSVCLEWRLYFCTERPLAIIVK